MQGIVTHTILIKNMLCNCCIKVIQSEFLQHGIDVISIELGRAVVSYDSSGTSIEDIRKILNDNDFDLIHDRDSVLVEQIKQAVIELVHFSGNVNSIIRKSEYLIDKMNMSYQTISKLFSRNEKITLQKYIILQKIEKTKELLLCGELTLSEIAYMMDFSSVQHLSNAFRKITGCSVSDYKKQEIIRKTPLNRLITGQ